MEIYDVLHLKASARGARVQEREKRVLLQAVYMSEQRNTVWMNTIAQKFAKTVNLIVEACVGTCPVAKACMLLRTRKRIIVCEVDSSCVTELMPQ